MTSTNKTNCFSFRRLRAGLDLIEPYLSKNAAPQVFPIGDALAIYLPKSKTLSKKKLGELEATGWSYDHTYHCVVFNAPDLNELLTHSDKRIREQAVQHMRHRESRYAVA